MNLEKDPLQKRLEITNWIILAAMLAVGLAFGSTRFGLGILCGGLISVINFHGLYRNLRSVFTHRTDGAGKAVMIRYYIRLALTALVLYWVISGGLVDVIGLVIGLSVVLMNIMITTVCMLTKRNYAGEVR